MELMFIFMMFWTGLGGLIFLGMYNQNKQLERQYKDAIRQLNVVAISRGNGR